MYRLALCLPSVGQPQGLPVPHEIPKTRFSLDFFHTHFLNNTRDEQANKKARVPNGTWPYSRVK